MTTMEEEGEEELMRLERSVRRILELKDDVASDNEVKEVSTGDEMIGTIGRMKRGVELWRGEELTENSVNRSIVRGGSVLLKDAGSR